MGVTISLQCTCHRGMPLVCSLHYTRNVPGEFPALHKEYPWCVPCTTQGLPLVCSLHYTRNAPGVFLALHKDCLQMPNLLRSSLLNSTVMPIITKLMFRFQHFHCIAVMFGKRWIASAYNCPIVIYRNYPQCTVHGDEPKTPT